MKSRRIWYVRFVSLLIALTIGSMAVIGHLTLARATVVLPEKLDTFTSAFPIEIKKDAGQDAMYGEVISRDYELTDSFAVEVSTITSDKAGLTVNITNNYTQNQTLVKTTRLLSPDNKLFRLTKTVTVPAGSSVEVMAEADATGQEYIIGPAKFIIPGLRQDLQDKIYGQSSQASTFERPGSAIVTNEAVDAGVKQLELKATVMAMNDIQSQIPAGFVLEEKQLTTKTVSVTADPAVGKEGSATIVKATIHVSALLFDHKLLLEKASDKLRGELAEPEKLKSIQSDSLEYSITNFDEGGQSALLDVTLSANVAIGAGASIDTRELAGKTASEAKAFLESQGIENAEVTLWPFWVVTIPRIQEHVKVEYK